MIFCNSHGRVIDLAAVINDVFDSEQQEGQTTQQESDAMDIEDESAEERELPVSVAAAVVAPAFARLSQSGTNRSNLSNNDSNRVEDFEDRRGEPVQAGKVFARVLYGDMDQGARAKVVSAFRKRKFQILVSTDVAARGIDIPSISVVRSSNEQDMRSNLIPSLL